jgi:hypothetical protein
MAVFVAACVAAGAALGGTPERARALGLCTGVRNLALALLVAATHLDDPAVDAALLAFGAVMLAGPALVALWWRRGGRYCDAAFVLDGARADPLAMQALDVGAGPRTLGELRGTDRARV